MLSQYDILLDRDVGTPQLIRTELREGDYFMTSPNVVVAIMNELFKLDVLAEECCYMIALNTKSCILGICLVSKGNVSSTMMGPREIYLRALLLGASFIILVHNHPSGSSEPSSADLISTKKVVEVGDLVGIPVTDHIIIGRSQWCSMKEKELL